MLTSALVLQSAEEIKLEDVPEAALAALDALLGQEWATLSEHNQGRACEIVRRLTGMHNLKLAAVEHVPHVLGHSSEGEGATMWSSQCKGSESTDLR